MRTAAVRARATLMLAVTCALAALVAGLLAPVGLGAGGTERPAFAAPKDDGLDLVVPVLAPMLPGQQGWVSAFWVATKDVCDVQVTASGPGLTIRHPTNTGSYSSLYINSGLATGNMDYTAFDIAVSSSASGSVPVTLTVSFNQLPPGQIKKDDDLRVKKFDCKGPKGGGTVTATLPVVPSTGAAVIQRTTTLSVPRHTPAWVTIAFGGTKPGLANFRVTLTPPAGLTVTYPGEGGSAGLHGAPTLPVGQNDYVAVRLDAAGLAPGTYQVPVRATYTGGTFNGQLTVTVT